MMVAYEYDGILYYRLGDLPNEYRDEFKQWIAHQTCPLIPDLEPQDAVYASDWERFLRTKRGKFAVWD